MDLVRYADSGGFEFDVDRPEMYRYRDYLIESFNEDKPYDQFIREQIAGDEITPQSDEAMIATGFLRLGPEGGGTRQDALDDLVATTTLTFMGMTVSCARCHNHKFDAIPQKDYYRIQAVFFSTQNSSIRWRRRTRSQRTRRNANGSRRSSSHSKPERLRSRSRFTIRSSRVRWRSFRTTCSLRGGPRRISAPKGNA